MEAVVISDPLRIPVTAQRLADGRIIIMAPGKKAMFFSVAEIDRLYKFATLGTLQRHVANDG